MVKKRKRKNRPTFNIIIKEKKGKRKKDFLKGIDITKLSPKEQKLLVKVQGLRTKRLSLSPKKTTSERLRELILKEKILESSRKKKILNEQFSTSRKLNLSNLQNIAEKRVLSRIPTTAPPRLKKKLSQKLQISSRPKTIIERDIESPIRTVINETPRGKIFEENIFGDEDFRGREDFTRIS